MSKILPIIREPNKKLRIKSEVMDISKLLKKQSFIGDMILTMEKKDGIGLAAPQVGVNERLIVVSHKDGTLVMINPVVKKKSWKKEWDEEGCLSVPNVYGQVRRSVRVICEYFDKDGNKKTLEAKGMLARVIQHEIDHLDGILFIDKAKDIIHVDRPV